LVTDAALQVWARREKRNNGKSKYFAATRGVARTHSRAFLHSMQTRTVPSSAKKILLGREPRRHLRFVHVGNRAAIIIDLKEETMERLARLNVLAALFSFGLIAAIVFGIV